MSSAAPTFVTDDSRRLGDRYIQSSGLSLTIVAVELMTSLHLHAPSPFLGSILPAYSAALFSTKVLRYKLSTTLLYFYFVNNLIQY